MSAGYEGRQAMNELNYASLEASKRLVEAGIVLETQSVWFHGTKGTWHLSEREGDER
jgi:L-lysine 2,3-aminomutase